MNFLFSFAQEHIKELKAKLASQSIVIGALKKNLILQGQEHKNQMEIEQETQTDLRSEIDKLEAKLDMKEKQLEQAKNATAMGRDLEWTKRCRTSLTVSMKKDRETIAKLQAENLELKRNANSCDFALQNARQLCVTLASEQSSLESENMSLMENLILTQEELQLTQNVLEDSRALNEELTRSLSESKKNSEGPLDMDWALRRVAEFRKVSERAQDLDKQLKEAREELEKYKQGDESTEESMEEMEEEQEYEMMAYLF